MNYIKLYEDFCLYCKKTTSIQRLKKRNPNDERLLLNIQDIYTEKHHILPISLGGNNDKENLVELLPAEHYFAHLVRFKAFSNRADFIAIRLMLTGFLKKNNINKKEINILNVSKRVGRYKQKINMFRKKFGWHTKEGLQNISKARKKTMPAIDAITKEKIGMVPIDHENILNGKWIHHSKNKKSVINTITGKKEYIYKDEMKSYHINNVRSQKGEKNNNYRKINDEVINRIFLCVSQSIVEEHLIINKLISNLKNNFTEYNNKISSNWIKNIFVNHNNLINAYNLKYNTNYKYDRFFRSNEQKLYLSNLNKEKNKK